MYSVIPHEVSSAAGTAPQLWEQEKVRQIIDPFLLSKEALERVVSAMNEDFNNGLSDDPKVNERSPIKMLPTYIRSKPDGKEEGKFFALDLGGTNFRVLLVHIHAGEISVKHQKYPVDDSKMKGSADDLFGYIAESLAKFAKENGVTDGKLKSVGFTFSFPVTQTSLFSGALVKWTKGYTTSGVEGQDIVQLLHDAIKKRKQIEVERIALLNDTTGTMVSCAFEDPNVEIGLILGTGTNACYMESLDRVKKWNDDRNDPKQVIINTEWGAFGEKGELTFVKTFADEAVDISSLYPGQQIYEKMISGMYLGEIARQVLVRLVKEKVLFDGNLTPALAKTGGFESSYVSDIASDNAEKVLKIVQSLGYEPSLRDLQRVKDVCDAVSIRAARLAAAGLAAIVRRIKKDKVTVAVDGSLFKYHPKFKSYMEVALENLLPHAKVTLRLSEDGSGRGAGLAAAVADRTAS